MKNSISKKIQCIALGACMSVVIISALRVMFEVSKDINGFISFGAFALVLAFQFFLFYMLIGLYVQIFKDSFGRV